MDGGGTWRDPPGWMGDEEVRVPDGLSGSEWRRAEASGRGRGPFSGRAMIMARGLGARNVRRVPCLQPAGQYVPDSSRARKREALPSYFEEEGHSHERDDDRHEGPRVTAIAKGAWAPLRRPLFRALWISDVVSNIGTWMHDSAAAWLMTLLAPSPLMVSLVQAATTLPLFLLELPAGAIADVLDRRRVLLAAQVWLFAATATLGVLTLLGVVQPWMLLVITLAVGAGNAIDLPAWQAIIPEAVPPHELPAAVGLGSIAINIARAVGPALAGLIIVAAGPGPVFLINAVSILGVFFVLWRWRRKPVRTTLPAERLASAMRAGVRYVRFAPALRTVVVRTAAFVGFARDRKSTRLNSSQGYISYALSC